MRGTICIIIGSLNRGGAERHVVRIASELTQRSATVSIFCLGEEGELAESVRSIGVEVQRPLFNRSDSKGKLLRICALCCNSIHLVCFLLSKRPQIAHMFLPEATIIGGIASWLTFVPVRISSRRSLNNYRIRQKLVGPFEAAVLKWMVKNVLGNSGAVIKQLREEGIANENLGLIYNGIALDENDSSVSNTSFRGDCGIASSAIVFTIVANLIPYKGHRDLISAFSQLSEQTEQEWVLVCLGGDSGILEELKSAAVEASIAGRIRWEGSVSNTDDYLAISDVGLLVSHEEGFSNAILEGMAAGLPMIVTDVGGNAEAVIDGVTGLVVPPHSPDSIAEALLKLIGDKGLRKQMGERGRRRIEENFTLEHCVDQYERVYEGLMAGEKMGAICGDDFVPILKSVND